MPKHFIVIINTYIKYNIVLIKLFINKFQICIMFDFTK